MGALHIFLVVNVSLKKNSSWKTFEALELSAANYLGSGTTRHHEEPYFFILRQSTGYSEIKTIESVKSNHTVVHCLFLTKAESIRLSVKLTDGPSYCDSVSLLKRLGAVEQQFDLHLRYQRKRGVAGSLCVINPTDCTHSTLIQR